MTIDPTAPSIAVNTPITADNVVVVNEDDALVISGTTTCVIDGEILVISITDGITTITDTVTVTINTWSMAAINLSQLSSGPISISASYTDTGGNSYSDATPFTHDNSAAVRMDGINQ